ncbi:MAG: hypothetical protein ACRD8W_25955 [Nitrososphaeraceae archaeon]
MTIVHFATCCNLVFNGQEWNRRQASDSDKVIAKVDSILKAEAEAQCDQNYYWRNQLII